MKVRRRGEVVRLRLDPVEARLLTTLFDDLIAVVASEADAEDPVQQRLFPAGYSDDVDADEEFRSLTESALRTERTDRAKQCVADLAADGRELELSSDDGQRWIQVLNDVRLALGTRLGVSEEDGPEIDPDDPEAPERAVYYWLTAVQDSLVGALMG